MMSFLKSFKYAFRGLFLAIKSERNLKIHLFIALLVIIFGFVLKISAVEWFAVFCCIALVISTELINTAIEKLADFVCQNRNKQIGQIKDISAAAVVVCAIFSVIIGVIIFLPKIVEYKMKGER
jgi:diacylglycerol kinase